MHEIVNMFLFTVMIGVILALQVPVLIKRKSAREAAAYFIILAAGAVYLYAYFLGKYLPTQINAFELAFSPLENAVKKILGMQ